MSTEPLNYPDDVFDAAFKTVRTVAMVGAKDDPDSSPYIVMRYLQNRGYRVIPVNPKLAGGRLCDETAYPDLDSVPMPFEMVDIFRNADAAGGVTDTAIRLKDEKQIRWIWMQLGIRNDEAAARAEAVGLSVVMDRCPKIEYARLYGSVRQK